MKPRKLSPFNWFIIGAILSISHAAQALPNQPCIGEGNNCTANDVQLLNGRLELISASANPCVLGNTVTVQLRADLISTGNERYDPAFWLATDGLSAETTTNTCYTDFLTPLQIPPVAPPNPPPADQNAPYWNLNSQGGTNTCGDIINKQTTHRFIGATIAGGPATAAFIQIKCIDLVGPPGIVDISACASWSNQANHVCTMPSDSAPSPTSKCRCNRADIPALTSVPCTTDGQCTLSGDACVPNLCVAGVCQPVPVTCSPPPDICHTTGACVAGMCPTVDCNMAPVCHTAVGAMCEPPPGGTGCTYPVDNGDPRCVAPFTCVMGICTPPGTVCTTADQCATVACFDKSCPIIPPAPNGVCTYTAAPNGTSCGSDDVCFNTVCVACITADQCPDAPTPENPNPCVVASCDANHECQYDPRDCTTTPSVPGIKCTLDCCDPTDGCVQTPSNNACSVFDFQCNVGMCGVDGVCVIDPQTGFPCGDPSSCTSGICVLEANNSAICHIINDCIAPDTCSTATCDGAGSCTISSRCACPEFCDGGIPTGTCMQCDATHPCEGNLDCVDGVCVGCAVDTDCKEGDECTIARCVNRACRYTQNEACCPVSGCAVDSDCKEGDECTIQKCINHECHYEQIEDCCPGDDQDCSRHVGSSHDQGRADRSGGRAPRPVPVPISIPVPVPVPISVPTPVPTPAVVPVATVVAEPAVIAPINNHPNSFPDSGGVKDAPVDSGNEESGSSCATTGTDIKDLWMWVMILAGGYSMRRQKRAMPR